MDFKNLNLIYIGSKKEHGKIELQVIGAKIYSAPMFSKYFINIISVLKHIQKSKPDAILVESAYTGGLMAFILSKITSLPYFFYIIGDIKEETKESIPLLDKLYKKILKIIIFKFSVFSLRRAKAIFTVSNYLNNKTRYLINIPQKEIITVYPSIDLNRFHPHNDTYIFKKLLGISHETKILLTVMNFSFPSKVGGLIHFIETIGEILKKYTNLKYVIAGDGRLRILIEKKIEKMGLKDSILLPGFTREIENAYASSEFLIHNSFLDMAPLTILEAGASGKPVIVNRCGGMPELVNNGDTGFIVGKTDCKGLKDKIIELLENSELRYNMGINARKRIEKLHNREKIGNILSKKMKEYI